VSENYLRQLVLIAVASAAETSSIQAIEIITPHNNGEVQSLFLSFEVPLNGDDCTAQLPVQRSQVFQSFAS